MNLYDNDDGFKVFTLAQVNAILPQVIVRTERAVELLEIARKHHESGDAVDSEGTRDDFDKRSGKILEDWSREIALLGAYPKGYFTVDFKSPIPETLFCWTLGEDRIRHTHKTHETFKDRIRIIDELTLGFEDSLN